MQQYGFWYDWQGRSPQLEHDFRVRSNSMAPIIPDHLGEGPLCAEPRPLPLAARALLVRGAQWIGQVGPATASNRRCGRSRPGRGQGFEHGTQKPVECMKRPIENNSSPGQAVYEPFSGSGTTIIAAEITGRVLPRDRVAAASTSMWRSSAGRPSRATRRAWSGDGRTFAAVAAERREPAQRPPVRRAEGQARSEVSG